MPSLLRLATSFGLVLVTLALLAVADVSADDADPRLAALTLADAVDLALRENPATRAAWHDAQAAAASLGAERGAWYPTVDLEGSVTRGNNVSAGWITTRTLGANLSWLLFDFGGRSSRIETARQTLLAAEQARGAAVQDAILDVTVAWFAHAGAQAILTANQASLAEADSALAAAVARHDLGLATIADVLQARTACSEVRLAVHETSGQVRITRGALATVMGWPAHTPLAIVVDSLAVAPTAIARDVDGLIEAAVRERPDLLAARAQARAFEAAAGVRRSALWPSLRVGALSALVWTGEEDDPADRHAAALILDVPLFAGLSRRRELQAAESAADAQAERARGYEQGVIFDVFAAHSEFQTETERVATAADLLASARASADVAEGRYREGVGDILDLLSAQRALASARAIEINARLGWFTSLARLARGVGVLGLPAQATLVPGAVLPEVKP